MGRQGVEGKSPWGLALLVPLLAALAVAGLLGAPAEASKRAYCNQPWGSQPKQLGNGSPGFPSSLLTGVRAGTYTCFDRLVLDLAGPAQGYRVEYVPRVTQDGSGAPVLLRGGAFLQVAVAAAAHDENGRPTYRPADPSHLANVSGFTTFRQIAFAGDFEGVTTVGLGVRATLPFRAFTLAGPGSGSRVVVDVSHRWV